MTPNFFRRITDWWNRPPAPACYDCGASIIAADDDARICVQCGGRNRRVGHRVGSNPPPVGGKRLPSPGPPWRVPDKQRQDRPPPGTIVELGPDEPAPVWPQPSAVPANDDLALLLARLLTEALNELFEVTRDPDRQRSEIEAVRKSIQARASAAIDASTDPQPLTADEVRKIVREEIQRAMRTVGKRGKMWPG